MPMGHQIIKRKLINILILINIYDGYGESRTIVYYLYYLQCIFLPGNGFRLCDIEIRGSFGPAFIAFS